MIQITKIGVGAVAVIILAGFAGVGGAVYHQSQVISHLQQPVLVRTVVVTPTSVPVVVTATPAATLKTRIGTPVSVTKPLTK